jgi:hypothetical protein
MAVMVVARSERTMIEAIIGAIFLFLVGCYIYSLWGINTTYDWLYKRNNGNDDDQPKPPKCPNCGW